MKFYPIHMTAEQICDALRTLNEPSRDLDDRIWHWVNKEKLNPRAPGWQYDLLPAPKYTDSLDAAASLIPITGEKGHSDERMDYIINHVNSGLSIGASVGTGNPDAMVFSCNAASALTLASIVAHVCETRQ